MIPSTDTRFLLTLHHDRAAALWAEAADERLARAARPPGAHRHAHWWSRLGHRADTRAPVHP